MLLTYLLSIHISFTDIYIVIIDLKSDQSLDLFLLILDLKSILKIRLIKDHLIFNHFNSQNYPKNIEIYI
jgi:hypothetical protein